MPELDPYYPGNLCPACGAEGAQPQYHERPILAVFGSGPQFPCSGPENDGQKPHMCLRCPACGYAWMKGALPAEEPAE